MPDKDHPIVIRARNSTTGGVQRSWLSLPIADPALKSWMQQEKSYPENGDISVYSSAPFLMPHLTDPESTLELQVMNLLAERICRMSMPRRYIYEGIVHMMEAKQPKLRLVELVQLTQHLNLVECVPGIMNDEDLGDMILEAGHVPEAVGLSPQARELLSRSMIGARARLKEDGVYTEAGYVYPVSPLPETMKTLSIHSFQQQLDYIFRVVIYPYDYEGTDEPPKKTATLYLPATEEQIYEALEHIDVAGLIDCGWDVTGAPNEQMKELIDIQEFEPCNLLAWRLQSDFSSVPVAAALMEAAECQDADDALKLLDTIDQYNLICSDDPSDFALLYLKEKLSENALELYQSALEGLRTETLDNLGEELLGKLNCVSTAAGFLYRTDEKPIPLLDNGLGQTWYEGRIT